MIARAKGLALPILIACALIAGGGVRLTFAQQDFGTKVKRIFEPTPPPKKRKASSKKKGFTHAVTIAISERFTFRLAEKEIDTGAFTESIAGEEKGELSEEESQSESDAGSIRNSHTQANELAFAVSEKQAQEKGFTHADAERNAESVPRSGRGNSKPKSHSQSKKDASSRREHFA